MNKTFNTIASSMVMFALVLSAFVTPATTVVAQTTDANGAASASSQASSHTECALEASSYTINTGESVTLNWNTAGFENLTLNGESLNSDAGSKTFNNVTENTSYILKGTNGNGSDCEATVNITCLQAPDTQLCRSGDQHYDPRGDLSGVIYAEGKGRVTNTSQYCDYEVGLASYEKFDEIIDNQHIFDHTSGVVPAKSDLELMINVPQCAYQIDLFWGEVLLSLDGKRYAHRLLDAKHLNGNNYCGVVERKCELEVKKTVSTHDAIPGQELTYTIDVKNVGDAICTGGGVRIYDVVDQNLTYLRHEVTNNLSAGYGNKPVYTNADRTLRFNGHDLEPGEAGTITWVGEVAEPTQCGDFTVKNQAKATAKELNNFQTWAYSQTVHTTIENDCIAPKVPECTLTPNTQTIKHGETATLAWTTDFATEVTISNFGSVALDGSDQTAALFANTGYTLTATGAGGTVTCDAQVNVTRDNPVAPTCPLSPAEGRTIVNFAGGKLRTDQGASRAETGIQNINLDTGKYDVTLVSWDGYNHRVNASQPHERWQLQFTNNGSVAAESGIIGDLADNVREAIKTEKVNTDLAITGTVNGVRAIQPFYPDTSSPNSLYPICAAIDEKEVVTPPPSCDLFTATPGAITVGDTVTLTWETTNGVQAFLNNGINEVDLDGTMEVAPIESTTYQLTVIGEEDKTVDCEVPVTVSVDAVPDCKAFTATPSTLPVGGGDVTLAWEVEDAVEIAITPTVGTTSDLTGSETVNVTESTTYTLTATDDNGDTVSCPAPVAVADPEPVFTCSENVTFRASDTSIDRGDDITLTWDTTNVDSVSISVINETALSGSREVSPSSDTRYVLTATRGNESIDCPLSIDVSSGGGGGGGGSSSPRCELEISDTKINRGEEITLTWDTSRATEVTITDDRGDIVFTTDEYLARDKEEFYDGEITLTPTRDTEYTLLAERGSRDRECEVEVEIEDEVTVLETRDQAPLVAGISLSQVPYTGFEAGPFMTLMFYALLVAWSLYITYLLVIRKRTASDDVVTMEETPAHKTENAEAMRQAEAIRPDVFTPSVVAQQATTEATPANLPTGTPTIGYDNHVETPVTVNPHQVETDVVTELENRAHEQKALLSSDAVRHFISNTAGSVERNEALDEVIAEAKKHYPLEDGWVVVNEARMQNLCETCQLNREKQTNESFVPATVPEGTGSLAEAIVTGNVVAAYEMIGNRPMFALADAAADLDAVYRKRLGNDVEVSNLLVSETAALSDEQIKNMIAALTGALDGTYTDEASAVKMAIMKAVKEVA